MHRENAPIDWEAIYEVSPVPTTVINRRRRVVSINRAFIAFVRERLDEEIQREDRIGRDLLDFVDPLNDPVGVEGWRRICSDLLEREIPYRNEEYVFRSSGGREVVTDVSANPFRDQDGEIVGAVITRQDVTERVMARRREQRTMTQHLHSLASQLTSAEERERRRIATELHDRIGQMLAISKIKLGVLREMVSSTELTGPIDEVYGFVEQMVQDTRSLTFALSWPMLRREGLGPALAELVEQMESWYGISIGIEDSGAPGLIDQEMQVVLFQAVRESLMNVVKHAQTDEARVSLGGRQNHMCIEVADEGVGFDVSKLDPPRGRCEGFGLLNTRERLDSFGGGLEIESEPGRGTCVRMWMPLEEEPQGRGNAEVKGRSADLLPSPGRLRG